MPRDPISRINAVVSLNSINLAIQPKRGSILNIILSFKLPRYDETTPMEATLSGPILFKIVIVRNFPIYHLQFTSKQGFVTIKNREQSSRTYIILIDETCISLNHFYKALSQRALIANLRVNPQGKASILLHFLFASCN